jgi:uncharacterized protein YutE (UPF0331/DUF86 family)
MESEFNGIERRLNELSERLGRLQALKTKPRLTFDHEPLLRDIVERNLEVAIQCMIDISNRIISMEKAQKPVDSYDAILRMGELNVLPVEFARILAPVAGFRNILAHEYLVVNWDIVYGNLQKLDDLDKFAEYIRSWLRNR